MDLAKLEALIDLMQRKGALYVKFEGVEVHVNPGSVVPPDGIPVTVENENSDVRELPSEEEELTPGARDINPLLKNKKLWLNGKRPKL